MDRFQEYRLLIHEQPDPPAISIKFFDTTLSKIVKLESEIKKVRTYKGVLLIEQSMFELNKDPVFIVELEGTPSEIEHFKGVQEILKRKLRNIFLQAGEKKKGLLEEKVTDLAPERPTKTVELEQHNSILQEENSELLAKFTSAEIQTTRRRLIEIEKLQDAIKTELELQNERIDLISRSTKDAGKTLGKANQQIDGNNRRLMRRVLFLFIICLSFVLAIAHFHHRD